MIEQNQHACDSQLPDIGSLRADTAELLSDLTTQIETFRRVFTTTTKSSVGAPLPERPTNVVFVDDLAKCMDCSWARAEITDDHASADIIAQCCKMLETSLQILQQAQRLHDDTVNLSAAAET